MNLGKTFFIEEKCIQGQVEITFYHVNGTRFYLVTAAQLHRLHRILMSMIMVGTVSVSEDGGWIKYHLQERWNQLFRNNKENAQ